MGQAIIGLNKLEILSSSAVPAFRLGTVGGYDDPVNGYQEFIYGQAGDANMAAAGYLGVMGTGFVFLTCNTTNTAPGANGHGSRLGAVQGAMAANSYGWFQIFGKGNVRSLASAAKGTRLNCTATAGAVDDDGTAGTEVLNGLTLGTATGGATAINADAYFNYPSVGATL